MRDWAATESLVQQAFIDAGTHLRSYQLGTDIGAWVRTLTRTRLRKERRTMSRAERRLAAYREPLGERLRSAEPVRDDADVYLAALRSGRDGRPATRRLRYERGAVVRGHRRGARADPGRRAEGELPHPVPAPRLY